MNRSMVQLMKLLRRGVANDGDGRELIHLLRSAFTACGALLVSAPGAHAWFLKEGVPPAWERDHHRLAHEDPSIQALSRLPPGYWWSGDHEVPEAARTSEIWSCFRAAGLRDIAVTRAYSPFSDDLYVVLYRDDRGFERAELDLLELLYPHLAGGLSTRRAVAAVEGAPQSTHPWVRIVLPSGRVEVPAAARSFIARKLGSVSPAGWVKVERALVAAALRFNQPHGGGRSQLLWPGLRLELAVAPTRAGERLAMLGLLLEEEEAADAPLLPAVHALLSPRQRAVACAFAAGAPLPVVAEQQRIGLHTARTHLRAAYARLGVRTRAELTRALART